MPTFSKISMMFTESASYKSDDYITPGGAAYHIIYTDTLYDGMLYMYVCIFTDMYVYIYIYPSPMQYKDLGTRVAQSA